MKRALLICSVLALGLAGAWGADADAVSQAAEALFTTNNWWTMAPMSSVVIGSLAGGLVVLSVVFFDRIHVDDPVGAISVHLVCGIWGTMAVGWFGQKAGLAQLAYQARVSEDEEKEGLDIREHGSEAYPTFQPVAEM